MDIRDNNHETLIPGSFLESPGLESASPERERRHTHFVGAGDAVSGPEILYMGGPWKKSLKTCFCCILMYSGWW